MLVELRCCTVRAGWLPEYLARYAAEGLPRRRAHGGRLVGSYTSETGALNQLIELWAFRDAAEREASRAAAAADAGWRAFRESALDLVQDEDVRLLKDTAFSPAPPAEG